MMHTLLLVDYENVPKVDLSVLDEGYRAVIFVGKNQEPPKASKRKESAHRFVRVDFQKIEGTGRNALDFHIAFHLGRLFETSPDTECVVIAKDKGYDPLLAHLNKSGMKCRRIADWDALVSEQLKGPTALAQHSNLAEISDPELTVCARCKKSTTIEHYGGRWCSNCGCFAAPPDRSLLPSASIKTRDDARSPQRYAPREYVNMPECGWCHRRTDMSDGIFEEGEWMCGHCVRRYAV